MSDFTINKPRLKILGFYRSSIEQTTDASCEVSHHRTCSEARILAFRLSRPAITIKRSLFYPQGKNRLFLPLPVFAKHSFWLLVFRCFYIPLETSGVLFPWRLFLKSFSGTCTTCMTQNFQIFSITGHLCDKAVTDSELSVSCVLGLTLTLTSVPSQAFPTVFIFGSEELLHDYRKQISW